MDRRLLMRRVFAAIAVFMLACSSILLSVSNAENSIIRENTLEEILTSYDEDQVVLSNQLQIVQNDVNFRDAPNGKVLGRLQGGIILECLEETQYKGELWYCARSAEYGEGYVVGTFAKPVWNNMNWWSLSDTGNVITDNMVLFAY